MFYSLENSATAQEKGRPNKRLISERPSTISDQ